MCLKPSGCCWRRCREGPGQGGSKRRGHLVAAIMQRKLDCRGWRLVVTGHSLGAGAAALIAMRLHARFPGACPPPPMSSWPGEPVCNRSNCSAMLKSS